MDANEKAQRLALVSNAKFKLDRAGNIVGSDEPILQSVIDEAMNMPEQEFSDRIEKERRDNIVAQLRLDYGMRAAYLAYQSANGSGSFDGFARRAVDAVEDEK